VIFEALKESADRGELLLVEDGYCRVRLRREGVLVIREILVTRPNRGIGTALLERLKAWPGVHAVVARCPADLAANGWYARRGFLHVGTYPARSGREVNEWYLALS